MDSTTPVEKLAAIATDLSTSSPGSSKKLMDQLSNKDELTKLFGDSTQLSQLLPTLNGCCLMVNQSLKQVLSKAVNEKVYSSDLNTDFAQSASSLQSMIC